MKRELNMYVGKITLLLSLNRRRQNGIRSLEQRKMAVLLDYVYCYETD